MKRTVLLLVSILILFSCKKDKGLSNDEIIQGLKDALSVGTNNSVVNANKINGYFGDSRIKIPFPDDAQFVMTAVQAIPIVGQPLVDTLILKLNRAAENAATKAKPIFINAITGITITDGLSILQGANDAATQYLKGHTYNDLGTAFKPDIQQSLTDVGAQQAWKSVTDVYNSIPLAQPVNTDLAKYTTNKALDGMFVLIADEELKIRTDPVARVDDILKKVFGNQ
jgi:hypothetical protein